jgi:2-(1,2-epoxy-1,2-dihydrophenyl)acetyl-CoA isomerase
LRIGLVSEVVPLAELGAAAARLAAEIALGAPVAVAQLKRTLCDHAHRSLDEALDREATCQAIDYGTEDMKEAIAAFGERRAPVFRGR